MQWWQQRNQKCSFLKQRLYRMDVYFRWNKKRNTFFKRSGCLGKQAALLEYFCLELVNLRNFHPGIVMIFWDSKTNMENQAETKAKRPWKPELHVAPLFLSASRVSCVGELALLEDDSVEEESVWATAVCGFSDGGRWVGRINSVQFGSGQRPHDFVHRVVIKSLLHGSPAWIVLRHSDDNFTS